MFPRHRVPRQRTLHITRRFAPALLAQARLGRQALVPDVVRQQQVARPQEIRGLVGQSPVPVRWVLVDAGAITHVDYSARIQTVHADTNQRFHDLLTAFKAETGCPVLVNTSFNVRGEPIVCTPEDACRCFMATDIDALVLENCVLHKDELKKNMTPAERESYLAQFQLD
jgi:predicted NodU family carbamoyl transferase